MRKYDKIVCGFVFGFELLLGVVLFAYPALPHLFIEIGITLTFWYTLVLTYAQSVTNQILY